MRKVFILATVFCGVGTPSVTHSQSTNAANSQQPMNARPGASSQDCTDSATKSTGQNTGSSTCPGADVGKAAPAKRFPYPGETTDSVSSTDTKSSNVPNGPQKGEPQSAGKRFPYPGESPAQQDQPLKDAGSSGESTSSSSSSSTDSPVPPEEDNNSPEALPAPKRARKKLPPVPRQTPDEREQEDVRIAAFYQNDGNYRAAYMRAKDAVNLADDDAEAQFALGESARKLGKLDEAQKSYKRCLELDPIPKLRKASEKALKEMSGS